ncbi:hypothetical protein KC19_5G031800 [Ceratodon purpureus]|uniref:Uncharacterized protein n=1 Tax=Ceratodon purpureus TaxID=3225 RepID=A0A8T0HYS2_CERPU|nr:hypothetical protein KC19_5G031800 [Ceratodon purpureus]
MCVQCLRCCCGNSLWSLCAIDFSFVVLGSLYPLNCDYFRPIFRLSCCQIQLVLEVARGFRVRSTPARRFAFSDAVLPITFHSRDRKVPISAADEAAGGLDGGRICW